MQLEASQLEAHRASLLGLCYRMTGSVADADDAVQATMERAWKHLPAFDARSSMRTWLTRIATNVCLDLLTHKSRRERPFEHGTPGDVASVTGPLAELPREHWVEPMLDSLISTDDPSDALARRESLQLAFVAVLQHLPPKQRAALLLADVLGWSAQDIAETLSLSVAAVNSALQRARATLAAKDVRPSSSDLSDAQRLTVRRYMDAFTRFDVDGLVALLTDDVTLSMPPIDFWLQGPASIRAWLLGPGGGCRGSRLLEASVNGLPAFAQYRFDPARGFFPWAVLVLELDGPRISRWNAFLDVQHLFPRFGFPPSL